MSKDPAFLFYYQDFLVGTGDMTNEEVGAYIRVLCYQAAKGEVSEKHMKNICNTYEVHNSIKNKFILNKESGLFYNERLKNEVQKRKEYSESRANNRKSKESDKKDMNIISKSYVQHMENENENINENRSIVFYDPEKLKIELKKQESVKEAIAITYKIELPEVDNLIDTFINEIIIKNKTGKCLSDYQDYFGNWLKFQFNKNGTGTGNHQPTAREKRRIGKQNYDFQF